MRIAYVLDTFPKLSETFILREIQELERQGHDLHFFALNRPAQQFDENVQAYEQRTFYRPSVFSTSFFRGRGSVLAAAGEALPGKFSDLRSRYFANIARVFALEMSPLGIERIHSHFASLPALLGALAAECLDAKFSFSAHANDVFVNPELLDWKTARADLVLTCNRAAHEHLLDQLPPDSRSKVRLVHHGIDLSGRSFDEKEDVEKPRQILSVGRLEEKKGFDDLLRAAKLLHQDGAEFHLQVVGDGGLRNALEDLRSELGLDEQVEFLGALPNTEVWGLLERAHLFALASRQTADGDRDGIPNVLLEAAVAGVPIVATRAGSIPELLGDDENGLLAPPSQPDVLSQCLSRLMTDPDLRQRLRKSAYQKVQQEFNLQANVTAMTRLFEHPPVSK